MAEEAFEFDDIIKLGDGINKAITDFKKLEKNVVKSIDNITKSSEKLSKSMDDVQSEIKQNMQASESLQKSTDQQSKGINEAAKNLDNLSKKYNNNAKSQKEAKTFTDSLGKSVEDQKQKVKILQKQYDQLDPSIEGNAQKMRQLSKQLVRTRAGIKDLSDASKRMNATFDKSDSSYNSLIKQNKRIKEILRKLPPEFIETNKRAQQLKNTFNQNSNSLKKFDKALGENFRNVGNYGNALGKMNGFAMGALKTLGAVGLAGAFLAGANALKDNVIQLEKNSKTLQKLLKVGGKDLDNYTARATALAQVFDQEFNMVARATNVIMKNFGNTGSEAFDLIEQAMIRGVDIQDDFLEQINEYSLFFEEAGLSAQNMVDVMIKGEGQGIFSDKALDAVKEASIRIREMPQTTKDAIDSLGISSNQLQKDLASGSKTVADAISEVSTEMGKLPAQSTTVGTAIADIFGGAGEDAGLKFLLTLKDINDESADYTKTLNESQKATANYLDSQAKLNEAIVSFGTDTETTSNKVKSFFNNLLVNGINTLKELNRLFTTSKERLQSFNKAISDSKDITLLNKQLQEAKDQLSFFDEELQKAKGIDRFSKDIADARIKILNEIGLIQDKIRSLEEPIDDENLKKEVKDSKKLANEKLKIEQDAQRNKRQAARDLAQFQLEQQIRLLEETKANEEASLSERIGAAELITEKEIAIAQLGREGKLDVSKQLLQEEKDLVEAQFEDLVIIAESAGEDFAEALFESAKIKAEEGDLSMLFDKASRIQLAQLETSRNEQLKVIEESNLSFKDKEKERFEIEEEFRVKSFERSLFFLKKQLALAEIGSEKRIQIAKEISAIELELSRQTSESKTIDEQAFVDAFLDLQASIFEAKQLQREQDLEEADLKLERNQEFFDREIELAGNNEQAKANIKEKFVQEERRLEGERLKIKRDIAKADKNQAIFTAIISTAQGIAKALGSSPPPINAILAAITAAAGGVQIAAIKAQPLPAFAEGTKSAPGGKSIVGERGTELWVDKKKGEAGLTPNTATLVDLPKGAEVFDAITTRKMLRNPEQLERSVSTNDSNESIMTSSAMLTNSKNKYLQIQSQGSRQKPIDYDRLGKAVANNLPPQQVWEIGQDNRMRFYTKHRNGSVTEHKGKESDFISAKNPIAKRLKELEKGR